MAEGIDWTAVSAMPMRFTRLTFGGCGISIDTATGEVTIPDGLALSEASRAFWLDLKNGFPGLFPKQGV